MSKDLPFMKRWPMQFWTSTSVLWLSMQKPPAHLEYNALLDLMWMNGGHFPDNDGLIAKAMHVSLDHWMARREAVLQVCDLVTGKHGEVLITHHRLAEDYAAAGQTITNKQNGAEKARDKKAAKAAKTKGKALPSLKPEAAIKDSSQPLTPASDVGTDAANKAEQSTSRAEADIPYSETLRPSQREYVPASTPIAEPKQRVNGNFGSLTDIVNHLTGGDGDV